MNTSNFGEIKDLQPKITNNIRYDSSYRFKKHEDNKKVIDYYNNLFSI